MAPLHGPVFPETVVVCDHADCTEEATIACRFGDGYYRPSPQAHRRERQTYVRYCAPHFNENERLFVFVDSCPIDQLDGRARKAVRERR